MKFIKFVKKKINLAILRILSKNYNRSLRKKYNGSDVTIISNSCLGGIIYHQLGLKFCSPTINLWIEEDGFFDFCLNIWPYINTEVEELDSSYDYPVGIIRPCSPLKPLIIHFNHYKTFAEAKFKWNQRKERIIDNKIFVFFDASAITQLTSEFINRWNSIRYPKMAFGCLNRKDIKDYYFIDFDNEIRPTKVCRPYKYGRLYFNQIDYVSFLNGFNGED